MGGLRRNNQRRRVTMDFHFTRRQRSFGVREARGLETHRSERQSRSMDLRQQSVLLAECMGRQHIHIASLSACNKAGRMRNCLARASE